MVGSRWPALYLAADCAVGPCTDRTALCSPHHSPLFRLLNPAHSWYLNCDTCLKPRPPLYRPAQSLTESAFTETWYANDAKRAVSLGFDGVKFDTQPGGPNWNISKWAEALAATGKDFLIEDCLDKHPDGTALSTNKPGWLHPKIDILHHPEYCPFSFYRTGGDNVSYGSFEPPYAMVLWRRSNVMQARFYSPDHALLLPSAFVCCSSPTSSLA